MAYDLKRKYQYLICYILNKLACDVIEGVVDAMAINSNKNKIGLKDKFHWPDLCCHR